MHVLLVAPGATPHASHQVNALLEMGHKVTFLDRFNPRPDAPARYKYVPLPGIPGMHRLSSRLTEFILPWVRAAQMRQIWNKTRPDVVNVQGVDGRAIWCALARLHPLVLSCWGSDINDLFENNDNDPGFQRRLKSMIGGVYDLPKCRRSATDRYRKRIGTALRIADHVTVVNPQLAQRCEQLAGQRLAIHYFRIGADFQRFRPGCASQAVQLRAELGIPLASKVLLSVRILQPLMGQEHIVKAFASLTEDAALPPTVLLLKDYLAFPDERERLQMLITQLKLNGKVIWVKDLGANRLPVLYALADVVINYPEQDGFPVSLFEAAGCGRPIVCADLVAYEGVFGDSVVRVAPADPAALGRGLRQCLMETPWTTSQRTESAYRIAHANGERAQNFKTLFHVLESVRRRQTSALV